MRKMGSKIARLLTDGDYRFMVLSSHGLYNTLDDEEYLKRKFRAVMGRELDLDNPKTFNEKLQWLKLYNRKPEYTMMVDKVLVRDYIASTIGEEYLIPLLGVWDDPDEIDFDKLPDQFVLKCNHNSGTGLCVCKDKSTLNIETVKTRLRKGLAENYYISNREWSYRDIPRKIIGEKYMEDAISPDGDVTGLLDYKFYCFNGEPRFLYVGYADISNGEKHDKLTYFDLDWNKTIFNRPDHAEIPFHVEKPVNFNEMIAIAKKLSTNIPFVRVDLYSIGNRIYFSEMTFYPGAGLAKFSPEEWNTTLGDWITLPEKTGSGRK